jgi:hypothetical protein
MLSASCFNSGGHAPLEFFVLTRQVPHTCTRNFAALAPAWASTMIEPIPMPADFYIDAKNGIVYSKATGVFSRVEALDQGGRLLRHPDFRPEFNQLYDFRDITKMVLSAEEVRSLASYTVFSAHSKRAFVVASDLQFGLSRMFRAYREMGGAQEIMIFREMPKALSWLSLAAEPDQNLFKLLAPPGDEA